jgi:hypothetical protein
MDDYSPLSFPRIALLCILAWSSWLILVDVRGGDAMQKNGMPLDGAPLWPMITGRFSPAIEKIDQIWNSAVEVRRAKTDDFRRV